jgi:hypothetical protein
MSSLILEKLFLGMGLLAALIAFGFSLAGVEAAYHAPHVSTVVHAGATCGFAITSGLSLLSAAVVHREKPGA